MDLPTIAPQPRSVTARPAPAAASRDDAALFGDRELSFLRFQQRVLGEAQDERNPLLDRIRFAAIVGTNLDDFVMVRGAALRPQLMKRLVIEDTVNALVASTYKYWRTHLMPALDAAGIHIIDYRKLTPAERQEVDAQFTELIRPHVKIAWCDEGAPFPAVRAIGLKHLVVARDASGRERLAIVRIPDGLSPLLQFGWHRGPRHASDDYVHPQRGYCWLDQAMPSNLVSLFEPGSVRSVHPFRVLRESDLPLNQGQRGSTLSADTVLDAVKRREQNPVLALIVDRAMPVPVVDELAEGLRAPMAAIHRSKVIVDPRRLWEVSRVARVDLHWPELVPHVPAALQGHSDILDTIQRGDVLLHHPFDSFQPVIDLLRQAAEDPDVRSISVTLYRTDRESPVGHALLEALRHGKQVRVLVELQARFDEERNAGWTQRLKDAGARVFHAPPGLKVHAKMAVIVRHEGDRLRRYAHVSSGNYNAFTARAYTDVSLMTCHDDIAADVSALFDALCEGPRRVQFQRLVVAPTAMRHELAALIAREIERHRATGDGQIILKMNALVDDTIIRRLYAASQAGVPIDLIVRGSCCLRPGLPGVSENIRVRSVLGRFLEHSRIWYFRNGGHEEAYVGSADLMPRNFDRRVEIMVPVPDPAVARRIRHEILGSYLADNVKAYELRSDDTYQRLAPRPGERAFHSQAALLDGDAGMTGPQGPAY